MVSELIPFLEVRVLGALSPLRAQMLGFACSWNYLELWPTVKHLLQPKEKNYAFKGLLC